MSATFRPVLAVAKSEPRSVAPDDAMVDDDLLLP
jgi:hypothetical protein